MGRKALMCQRLRDICGKGSVLKDSFQEECLLVEGCLTGGLKGVDMHDWNKKEGRELREHYALVLSG